MNAKRNGNVQREEGEEASKAPQKFEGGDVVGLTQAALRMGRIANMTPRLLYQIGQPNKFPVMGTFTTAQDGFCLILWPCCVDYVDRNKSDKPKRCTGHPAVYFEKVDVYRVPKKGDKSSSLYLPFIPGEVMGVHWEDDEENPRLTLNLAGVKMGGTGFFAKFLKNLAEGGKILP